MKNAVGELVKKVEDEYGDVQFAVDSIVMDRVSGEITVVCHEIAKEKE